METVCRLCGEVKIISVSVNILEDESLKLEIYNLLHIEIHQSDILPTKVCMSCVTAVRQTSAFINSCHHVQEILKKKYESNCEVTQNFDLVSRAICPGVSIPTGAEENRKNVTDEKRSIIPEEEHDIFMAVTEEPKKLTFIDSDKLTSEIILDSLEPDYNNISEVTRLTETSCNTLFENELTSNNGLMQNDLTAPLQCEISEIPLSLNEEELPVIKPEAIESDDCFASDPLEIKPAETYTANSNSIQKNDNAKVNKKDVPTLNFVLPESTRNTLSPVPIRLDGEVHMETDQNQLPDPEMTRSIANKQDVVKEHDGNNTKTLLCVTLTRISESEYRQKSAHDFASDTDDEMYEPDVSTSNEEYEITPASTALFCMNLKENMESVLKSVLTSEKDPLTKEADSGKSLKGAKKNRLFSKQDAVKNNFLRESNILVPTAVNSNMIEEEFGTVVDPADRSNKITNSKKLVNQSTREAEPNKISNLRRCSNEPCADRGGVSDVPHNKCQSENESSNRSCSTDSIDLATAENNGPKKSLISNKHRFLECKTCAKKFLSKSAFEDHLNWHTGYRPFKCDVCSNTFRRRSDLAVHSRIIHSKGKFKCHLCDYVAKHEGRLKSHMKTSHEKPFVCGICDYRCGAKRRIEEHIMSKHQNTNPSFVCELCGGSFRGKLCLRAHQEKVHFPEPQVCSTCGKLCPSLSNYKKHIQECGKERIRYTCDMCNQTYCKKAILKDHMNTHLNIQPYKCNVCDKKFFLRVRLLTHKAVHRAPTFQCEICLKSFNRKDNMKSHRKKHYENKGT